MGTDFAVLFACAVQSGRRGAYFMRRGLRCVDAVRMVIVKMNQKCTGTGAMVNPVEYDSARKENFR